MDIRKEVSFLTLIPLFIPDSMLSSLSKVSRPGLTDVTTPRRLSVAWASKPVRESPLLIEPAS